MKLYTEEQVNLAMRLMVEDRATFKQILELLTPIELPSNEEIEAYLEKTHTKAVNTPNVYYRTGFEKGAKWMKEQILGKEDKTFKQKSKWTKV
jgi:hypothetical protein